MHAQHVLQVTLAAPVTVSLVLVFDFGFVIDALLCSQGDLRHHQCSAQAAAKGKGVKPRVGSFSLLFMSRAAKKQHLTDSAVTCRWSRRRRRRGQADQGCFFLPCMTEAAKKQRLTTLIADAGGTEEEEGGAKPRAGLFSLPFMTRAAEKQKIAAQQEAAAVLAQLEAEDEQAEAGSDADVEFGDANGWEAGQGNAGRFTFGNGQASQQQVRLSLPFFLPASQVSALIDWYLYLCKREIGNR